MIYRVKTDSIVHEQIEDEAIIIDMNSGTYYSLRGAGSKVWKELVAGTGESRLCRLLGRAYDDQAGNIETSIQVLLRQLLDEGLIESTEDSPLDVEEELAEASLETKEPYQPPELEKFSDVQDLLLLDPIHDVTESGWPMHKGATDPSG